MAKLEVWHQDIDNYIPLANSHWTLDEHVSRCWFWKTCLFRTYWRFYHQTSFCATLCFFPCSMVYTTRLKLSQFTVAVCIRPNTRVQL